MNPIYPCIQSTPSTVVGKKYQKIYYLFKKIQYGSKTSRESHDLGIIFRKRVDRLEVANGTMKPYNHIDILQNKLMPTARETFWEDKCTFQDDLAI